MPLKQMSEFRRNDYTYKSPDGEEYEITIVQTPEREYVEIIKELEDGEKDQVSWDIEMLLDIADAVRDVVRKSPSLDVTRRAIQVPKPNIVDHRSDKTPSDMIQESVDKSMEKMGSSGIAPVQSLEAEVEQRMGTVHKMAPAESQIRRS